MSICLEIIIRGILEDCIKDMWMQGKIKERYSFVDDSHGLCIDKKEIISAELQACERLMKYAVDKTDVEIITEEIAELKMALDLLH